MITKISSFSPKMVSKINFCKKDVSLIKKDLVDNSDTFLRKTIRDDIEEKLGVGYKYADAIGTMSYVEALAHYANEEDVLNIETKKEADLEQKQVKKEYHVDENLLKTLGYYYCHPRRENELYTGARLVSKPNAIETAKNAGIRTILSLERYDDYYKKPVEEAGMKFISLDSIGNHNLRVFDIMETRWQEPELLIKMIDNPACWATKNLDGSIKKGVDKKILDVQSFVDILNGENEEYPLPIYYGCQWGTNRTYAWNCFYEILKDAPKTKALDENKVQELIELKEFMEECYSF